MTVDTKRLVALRVIVEGSPIDDGATTFTPEVGDVVYVEKRHAVAAAQAVYELPGVGRFILVPWGEVVMAGNARA